MASRKKEDLHDILHNAYELAVDAYIKKYPDSAKPFLTCSYRSGEEQEQLFKQVPKITNAHAGQSPHNYLPSLAFDIAFVKLNKTLDWSNTNFKNFADILIEIDKRIEWGGNFKSFKDNPHYQLINWKTFLV